MTNSSRHAVLRWTWVSWTSLFVTQRAVQKTGTANARRWTVLQGLNPKKVLGRVCCCQDPVPTLISVRSLCHPVFLRWWVGGWQQCTATCGSDGVRKRTVLCVRTMSGEERVLHPVECKHLLKPKPIVPCNRDVACGQDWAVGVWGEVVHFHLSLLSF